MNKVAKELEQHAEEYKGTSRRTIELPEEVFDALVELYKNKGKFTLPVEELNKMAGYNSANNRRPQMLESITRQDFNDKLDEGKELYIATKDNDTRYVITVRDIPTEEDEE